MRGSARTVGNRFQQAQLRVQPRGVNRDVGAGGLAGAHFRGNERPYFRLASYQISLSANWMSRGCVTSDCKPPAEVDAPDPSNNCAWLEPKNGKGGAKFARFRMLKNSARNCRLVLSEIFR